MKMGTRLFEVDQPRADLKNETFGGVKRTYGGGVWTHGGHNIMTALDRLFSLNDHALSRAPSCPSGRLRSLVLHANIQFVPARLLRRLTKRVQREDVMTMKRTIVTGLSAAGLALASGWVWAAGQYGPGVNDTEIKIGNTMAYSGPASAYGVIGKSEAAYFAMINDQGGVNGRKINFITRDDGYSPPKTVELVRKLVEEDQVLLMF